MSRIPPASRSHARRLGRIAAVAGVLLTLSAAPAGAAPPGPLGESTSGRFRLPGEQVVPADAETRYVPDGTPLELGLSGYAKVLCSAVFVSGRALEEAFANSGFLFVAPGDRPRIEPPVLDRAGAAVTLRAGGIARTARFYGDQGCVLDPRDGGGVRFAPTPVVSALPPADTQPWPMGDAAGETTSPPGIDRTELDAAVQEAFDPAGLTQALVVVHKGAIIAERYAPGVGKDTQLESWSMGKSLTAALVGVLVREGAFGIWDPAPVPEWHREPDDPRARIRIADLLRMSSGLRFSAPRDPGFGPESGYPDHMYVYTGAIDVFAYSVNRPLEFAPATEGRYRNSDPLALGSIVRRTVEASGQNYLTWPQRVLFDRIGIRRQVLEPDPWGNFLLTGFDYGTARNWARLGMLYLQDGVWLGERILPRGFVEFVSTPAPAWDIPVYGGLFWINGDGAWSLPPDAYYMAGGGGQRVFIVPSHDLVVVRLGHFRGDAAGMEALDRALAHLMRAVPPTRDGTAPGSQLWDPAID